MKKGFFFTALLAIFLTGCNLREELSTSIDTADMSNTDYLESIWQTEIFQNEQPTVDITCENNSNRITDEFSTEITLHTMAEYSIKYSNPDYDTTDPIEAAKEYVTELEDKPYVFNFRITDAAFLDEAIVHWTDSLRNCTGNENETVMKLYGWTTDMIDRGIFTVVRVDYYANYDHTKTPTSFEGDCYMNVFLVQYEDTGTWQVFDRNYFIYD